MSKKKVVKDAVQGGCRNQEFFVPQKGESGRVFVEWDLTSEGKAPEKFNLNYIDDGLACTDCNHRVVGYHVGHDHGFGYRHRHFYESTNELDGSHDWNKCTSLFFLDVSTELMKAGRVPSELLDIQTLVEVMA